MTSKPSLTNCPNGFRSDAMVVYTVSIIFCCVLIVHYVTIIQVVIVSGFHLFPFRTEKLSPSAPMVLHTRGRVGSRRFFKKREGLVSEMLARSYCMLLPVGRERSNGVEDLRGFKRMQEDRRGCRRDYMGYKRIFEGKV